MNLPKVLRFFLLVLFCIHFATLNAQTPQTSCGTPDSTLVKYLKKYEQSGELSRSRVSQGEKLEYRLALDINYATYVLYNRDKELITRVAYKFIDDASKIFERDVNVKLTVTSILIWDKPEPYQLINDVDYFSNVYNYWSQNRFEERDAVVSLSVRGGWFYGGYRMCSSNFPDPNYPSLPVDLLCHELGHTLGSPHTHSCSWPDGPIDYCETLESGSSECQSNYREFVNGTLMSYCRSILGFHPYCQNLMRDYSEGKVNTGFKLNPLSAKPAISPQLSLKQDSQTISNSPTFEWYASRSSERYQFQTSRNQNFTELVEDTIVNQSYFRSPGLGEGFYQARVRAENAIGTSAWSPNVPFQIPAFSESSTSPLLLQVLLRNDGIITGAFQKYDAVDAYQLEIRDLYSSSQPTVREYKTTSGKIQFFQTPLNGDILGRYALRLRVGLNKKWSLWSENKYLGSPWNSEMWTSTNLSNTSSSPVLAFRMYQPEIHNGISQTVEIAADASFSNPIFRSTFLSNGQNDWYSNKIIFHPKLEENKSYLVRTRVQWAPQLNSNWNTYKLSTGQQDRRFEFLGTVSPNLMSTNNTYYEFLQNKFYKVGEQLYVQSAYSGYYFTNDLKTWQPFITSSTKGKSPNSFIMFAASEEGINYVLDNNFTLIKYDKSGSHQTSYFSGNNLYTPRNVPGWIIKNDGLMFPTENTGVVHFKDGKWKFYGKDVLQSNRALYLKPDSEGRIWAVMEGGQVWSYQSESWSFEFTFIYWASLKGLNFDENNNLYLYGDFGLAKINKGENSWNMISSLDGLPIRKIVFDKHGQIWIASYQNTDQRGFRNYALIKMKGQKISMYSDGLNFLKEQFDIEIFNDKLLILTSGGEVHTFDETQIQGFEPISGYCTGSELSAMLTTNSTFGSNNQFSFQLINTEDGKTTTVANVTRDGNRVKAIIPTDLKKGVYRLRTSTTNPEIQSNLSKEFSISTLAVPEVAKEEISSFKVRLSVNPGDGLIYQWRLDGAGIPHENNHELNVYRTGNYSVAVTSESGCTSVSAGMHVTINEPDEVTLLQNAPNPASAMSDVAFYLPQEQEVRFELFNSKGQKIKELSNGLRQKGWHVLPIDCRNLSAGVYVYTLRVGKVVKSLKMVAL